MNNEYDNKKFFDEYAKMPRSREGLRKKVKQSGIKTLNFGIVQWGMNQMIFTEKLSAPK